MRVYLGILMVSVLCFSLLGKAGWCDEGIVSREKRAQGCWMGQLAGDSLGALAEFKSEEEIAAMFPEGPPRLLADGGTWDIMAGQPTDDSEMALLLARMLVEKKTYDQDGARECYIYWMNTPPFDIGNTTKAGLQGKPNPKSMSNGSVMRISPLGIFCAGLPLEQTKKWAYLDASITHPNRVCLDTTALLAMAIATEIEEGLSKEALYAKMLEWSKSMEPEVYEAVQLAASAPPEGFMERMGAAVVSLQNAIWQMLHSENLEEGVVDTVRRGGDTDTNAAIAGALMGAVYGIDAVPRQWRDSVSQCRPSASESRTKNPRPEVFWPADAMELSLKLLYRGEAGAAE